MVAPDLVGAVADRSGLGAALIFTLPETRGAKLE